MSDIEQLTKHFTDSLSLPADAQAWLLDLWNCIQLFDDVADGDIVKRADLNSVIWASMFGMHDNPFFRTYRDALLPVVGNAILKWQASDTVERTGAVTATSFAWRASYYDVVLAVLNITHGHKVAAENAHVVMAMYGEKFDEYLKEFPCPVQQ